MLQVSTNGTSNRDPCAAVVFVIGDVTVILGVVSGAVLPHAIAAVKAASAGATRNPEVILEWVSAHPISHRDMSKVTIPLRPPTPGTPAVAPRWPLPEVKPRHRPAVTLPSPATGSSHRPPVVPAAIPSSPEHVVKILRCTFSLWSAVLLLPTLLPGQTVTPVDIVRRLARMEDTMMVSAAAALPADKYRFKPTPAQMSFAEAVIHTWDTNRFECAAISGTSAPDEAKLAPTDSKETLVSALKASFTFCRSVLANVKEDDMGTSAPYWGGHPAPKAAMLIDLAQDWGDHYAILAMYLRLNGVKPPSAD